MPVAIAPLVQDRHPALPEVWVSSLRLGGFRNYTALSLEIAPGPVVLTGPNGAGKTNVMEALSLLAPGRGLRRTRADLLTHRPRGRSPDPAKTWSVAADVMVGDEPVSVGTGTMLQDDGEAGRRVVKINGELSSQTALAELLRCRG